MPSQSNSIRAAGLGLFVPTNAYCGLLLSTQSNWILWNRTGYKRDRTEADL